MKSIPIFSNSLGEEELDAVRKVFESKWLGMGEQTKLFEQEFAEKVGARYALATNSCTSALFIAIKTLGIGPGDEVIVPTIHFVGVANAILDAGAVPVFADCDASTFNIKPSEIARLKTNRTRAVFILHYGGHPCDYKAIEAECGGLYVIEDSANSLLSKYEGRNCGTLGDIGCFSFDPMKMLVVGDGGMMTFNRKSLYEKAKLLRYFGIVDQSSGLEAVKAGKDQWWEYEIDCIAGRHIPNDITSAIGRVQLKKIDSQLEKRKRIWGIYQSTFINLEWLAIPPEPIPGTTSSYYLYWIGLKNRLELARKLYENGIYATFRYYPLHLVKFYRGASKLPIAEAINKVALNLPIHHNLSDDDIERICECVSSL